jgi:hypothetical protein
MTLKYGVSITNITIKEHNSNERVNHYSHEHILIRYYSDSSHGRH